VGLARRRFGEQRRGQAPVACSARVRGGCKRDRARRGAQWGTRTVESRTVDERLFARAAVVLVPREPASLRPCVRALARVPLWASTLAAVSALPRASALARVSALPRALPRALQSAELALRASVALKASGPHRDVAACHGGSEH
jgi:hypothetical protein